MSPVANRRCGRMVREGYGWGEDGSQNGRVPRQVTDKPRSYFKTGDAGTQFPFLPVD